MARTLIADNIANVAGAAHGQPLEFMVRVIRENSAGTGIVSRDRKQVTPDTAGNFDVELEPGPCRVIIGGKPTDFECPVSVSAIRLGPLLEAAMDPPESNATGFVRDGGGFARAQVMTAAAYAALTSTTTPDPGSTFFIYT